MNEQELAALPVVDGFRQRGVDMTRIEAFTDAAFAFSLTMLVISFDELPGSFDELWLALKNIPAFAASFAMLSTFWYAHHKWSRRFGLDDFGTALFSLLFVFVMLIYIYPLRIVFSGFFAWITQQRLPYVFGELNPYDLINIFIIYGVGFVAMSCILALLYRHALSRRQVLSLDESEAFTTRSEMEAWTIMAGIGMLTVLWALLMPSRVAVWAASLYGLLAIVMPIFGTVKSRQFEALMARK
ncbi:MAG: TMEM175 family protein [Pseudomonadota bacterium]